MHPAKNMVIIGYSGHAYVAIDIFLSTGRKVMAYCDREEKSYNPFDLKYLGTEATALELIRQYDYFIAIGDNNARRKVYDNLHPRLGSPVNAIHTAAVISPSAKMENGIFIAAQASINPLVTVGTGVICNTGCTIDHECILGDFSHIAPGAVLCGNVRVGGGAFIGAGAVIRQGISIGSNAMVGAGCIVVKNVADNATVIGNPQKELTK